MDYTDPKDWFHFTVGTCCTALYLALLALAIYKQHQVNKQHQDIKIYEETYQVIIPIAKDLNQQHNALNTKLIEETKKNTNTHDQGSGI